MTTSSLVRVECEKDRFLISERGHVIYVALIRGTDSVSRNR